MTISGPQWKQQLIEAAIAVRQRGYAPYSKFLVGVALRSFTGELFTGCNVENASYGLTICAERAAVFCAVAAGQQNFEMMAVATQGAATPCGACRQVLAEFAPDLPILLVDVNNVNEPIETNLCDLLPRAFRPAELGKSQENK